MTITEERRSQSEIRRAMACDQAITDACEWMGITRDQFFGLALKWETLRARLWRRAPDDRFYLAWWGETGQSSICTNIVHQFSRSLIWAALDHIFGANDRLVYLDYGCGTAAVSFPFLKECRWAMLIDVPNLGQEFVKWRVRRHQVANVSVMTPEVIGQAAGTVCDLIACVDVLEHLRAPTRVFEQLDGLLRPGGLFLHRSPWAEGSEELEHLQEASEDWHRPGGGAEILTRRYSVLVPFQFGGLYQKLP